RRDDLQRTETRRSALVESITASEASMAARLRAFDELRDQVRVADEASQSLRAGFEALEGRIRDARRTLETVRAEAAQLDITRATAESDLTHLASSCVESLQASLDEVAAEVAELECQGLLASPKPVDDAPDAAEIEDDAAGAVPSAEADQAAAPTAPPMTPAPLVP